MVASDKHQKGAVGLAHFDNNADVFLLANLDSLPRSDVCTAHLRRGRNSAPCFFDSFFGRAARYGPVSLALSSFVRKKRFTSCSLQAESMSIKLCTQVDHKFMRL